MEYSDVYVYEVSPCRHLEFVVDSMGLRYASQKFFQMWKSISEDDPVPVNEKRKL